MQEDTARDKLTRDQVSGTALVRRATVVIAMTMAVTLGIAYLVGVSLSLTLCANLVVILVLLIALSRGIRLPRTGSNPRRIVARFAIIPVFVGIVALVAVELGAARLVGPWGFLAGFLVLLVLCNVVYFKWFEAADQSDK